MTGFRPPPSADSPLEAAPLVEIPWRRLSPRMLLVHPVREAVRYIPVLLVAFFAGRSSGNGHWWSIGVLGLVIVLSIVRWATTRFQITADQVQLRTGLVHQRTIVTPADRVRTVDVTAHALHRLLGLAKVEIGTGRVEKGGSDALVLDGLSATEAQSLRAELLHRGQVATRAPDPAATETELLRLDPSWIRYAPFTLSGLVTAVAVAGFTWNLLQQSSVDAGKIGAVRRTGRHLQDVPLWTAVVQVVIGIVVVITVLSVIGYLLAFWNFRLSRHAEGTLHVSRGLITTRSTSIEARRLRGVDLSQPLLLRLVRGARLSAVVTGLRSGRGADRANATLSPPAPRSVAAATAGRVLDEAGAVQAVGGSLAAHPRKALRRRLVRSVAPAALIAAAIVALALRFALAWLIPVAVAVLAIAGWLGTDRYRSLGHAVLGRYLVTRSGSAVRHRVALETDGIIGWNLTATFFQRRAGLLTLAATTAAGRKRYEIIDIEPDEASRVIRTATPDLLEQFLSG